MISFSIIAIIYNDNQAINAFIKSIKSLAYSSDKFEVIIIDDGSSPKIDLTSVEVGGLDFQYHYLERCSASSRSRARNLGALKAKYEYLVFLDGDHLVEDNFLEVYSKYFSYLKNKKCVLGSRRLTPVNKRRIILSTIEKNESLSKTKFIHFTPDIRLSMIKKFGVSTISGFAGRWHLFWSCNFVIEKTAYVEANGFDENFKGWGMEDVEFGYRLIKLGIEYELIDNYIWHLAAPPTPKDHDKYSSWIDNIIYFYDKHRDKAILAQYQFDDIYFNHAGIPNNLNANDLDWIRSYLKFEEKVKHIYSI